MSNILIHPVKREHLITFIHPKDQKGRPNLIEKVQRNPLWLGAFVFVVLPLKLRPVVTTLNTRRQLDSGLDLRLKIEVLKWPRQYLVNLYFVYLFSLPVRFKLVLYIFKNVSSQSSYTIHEYSVVRRRFWILESQV